MAAACLRKEKLQIGDVVRVRYGTRVDVEGVICCGPFNGGARWGVTVLSKHPPHRFYQASNLEKL